MEQDKHGLLAALNKEFKRLRFLYLCYLATAVMALILYFLDKRLTLLVLGGSLIFHLVVIRPRSKQYERSYLHVCGQSTLERRLGDARHTKEPTLLSEELLEARLVASNTTRGSILIREGGTGTYHGRPVRLGDVTFTHSFPMDGNTHHEFVTGTWVTVELGVDSGLDWRLIQKGVMMTQSMKEMIRQHSYLKRPMSAIPKWLETDDWQILCLEGTPDLPGGNFLDALRRLVGETNMALAVCVQKDRLHVFVTNRILGHKVSSRIPPNEAILSADFLPELDGILAASDALCTNI